MPDSPFWASISRMTTPPRFARLDRVATLLSLFAICSAAYPSMAFSQPPGVPLPQPQAAVGSQPAEGPGESIVELNLRGAVELQTLVEAVAKQLDVRFLYGTNLANRQVTVYTPARLPRSALPVLLGSLLRGENLAVVDSDVPGWKRIVDVAEMAPFAATGDAEEVLRRDGPAAAVTQVFVVRFAKVANLAQSLRPFLSRTGSNLAALPDEGLLIVTDFAVNVRTISELLKLIDQPTTQVVIEFHEARNRTPGALIEQAEALLAETRTRQGEAPRLGQVKLLADASGRRVVVAGERERVDEALGLLQRLDTGTDYLTRVYRLQNVNVQRIDKLVRGFVRADELEGTLETTIDDDGNMLIVRAPAEIHRQLETLLAELDRPVDATESPIQFYKLKNANAIEVLYSLLALQQVSGVGQAGFGGQFIPLGGIPFGGPLGGIGVGGLGMGGFGMGGLSPFAGAAIPGSNPPSIVQLPPPPVAGGPDRSQRQTGSMNANQSLGPLAAGTAAGLGGLGAGLGFGLGGGQVAVLPGGARVSADVGTNSLIVYAPASVQPLYEKLIRSLDQRRPQVLIEAVVVAVDTSDNFSLGVEFSGGDRQGAKRLFKFTSFGLSEVDPVTGALAVNPAFGFNGILVDPEVADVIVQALSTHQRGRIVASPKILVNDNQTGTLESISSVPFQSVNASDTVATTSLGGDQQAGTIITVTPQINEDDHLQLEFEVEFSSFVGQGTAALPPPRQIDRVGSVVTIPDGKTVVVGGLRRSSERGSFTGVPWLEKIPVVRQLTSLTSESTSTTSFFLFIRPKILRDSRFRDLRYLSELETHDAQHDGDYPSSVPILIPCPTSPQPVASSHDPMPR